MRRLNYTIFTFTFVSLSLIVSSALAQMATGTIASGTGNAGRAAIDPGESGLLNPAAIAHLNNYYSSVHYGVMKHPTEGDGDRLAVILSDGSPENFIAGSFAYVKKHVEIGNFSWTGQDFQASVAAFPFSKLSVGLGVHRFMSSISEVNSNQDNGTLGVLYTPNRTLGFGLVGYDLLNASDSVPLAARLRRTYAAGMNVIYQDMLRLRLDLVHPEVGNPGRRTEVLSGLETFFRDDFAFRVGAHWKETTDQMFLTTGMGFKGPRLSFDYSFQKDIRVGDGSRHMFDLWLPL